MNKASVAHCDVLVIGTGAAGFAAAVTAGYYGLEVILTEKANFFGGTTAWSGGAVWVPENAFAQKAGIKDSMDDAREYLRQEAGDFYDQVRSDAYLAWAPTMVDFFHYKTSVKFIPDFPFADYHPDKRGGVDGGRSLWAEPYDGRVLGDHFRNLQPPLKQYTLLGMGIGSGMDYRHFIRMRRSPSSAFYVAKRITRHLADVLCYKRGARLFNGNALIARLAKSAIDLKIPIWLNSPAKSLIVENGQVVGAVVHRNGEFIRVIARKGVVLACGGFPHDAERRKETFSPMQSLSLASDGNTGDGLRMAQAAGAAIRTHLLAAAYSAPMSKIPLRGGMTAAFPHFADRAKPGFIAVTSEGRRFTNESNSYHDFAQALINEGVDGVRRSAFVVCDHWAIRRYGLGFAKPWPLPLGPHLKSGYVISGKTIEELARKAGIDPVGLGKAIESFNLHARYGFDPEFRKGGNAYNRFQGDHTYTPNPCLRPLEKPPFYAVKVYAGDLGTLIGLNTNENAEVLNLDGKPIPGLFAAGNDMASVFAGSCPGGGITVGPALVFGYLIGRRLAERPANPKMD